MNTAALHHIEDHPDVKPLLDKEREIEAKIYRLRHDAAASITHAGTIDHAVDACLTDRPFEVETPAIAQTRKHDLERVLVAALSKLRGQIAEAKQKAKAAIGAELKLPEQARAFRARIAELAVDLNACLVSAGRFNEAMRFHGVDAPEAWPGDHANLFRTLAAHVLAIDDLDSVVSPGDRARLEVEAGRRSEPPPAWMMARHSAPVQPHNPIATEGYGELLVG